MDRVRCVRRFPTCRAQDVQQRLGLPVSAAAVWGLQHRRHPEEIAQLARAATDEVRTLTRCAVHLSGRRLARIWATPARKRTAPRQHPSIPICGRSGTFGLEPPVASVMSKLQSISVIVCNTVKTMRLHVVSPSAHFLMSPLHLCGRRCKRRVWHSHRWNAHVLGKLGLCNSGGPGRCLHKCIRWKTARLRTRPRREGGLLGRQHLWPAGGPCWKVHRRGCRYGELVRSPVRWNARVLGPGRCKRPN